MSITVKQVKQVYWVIYTRSEASVYRTIGPPVLGYRLLTGIPFYYIDLLLYLICVDVVIACNYKNTPMQNTEFFSHVKFEQSLIFFLYLLKT